jgi:hypothetical protein
MYRCSSTLASSISQEAPLQEQEKRTFALPERPPTCRKCNQRPILLKPYWKNPSTLPTSPSIAWIANPRNSFTLRNISRPSFARLLSIYTVTQKKAPNRWYRLGLEQRLVQERWSLVGATPGTCTPPPVRSGCVAGWMGPARPAAAGGECTI